MALKLPKMILFDYGNTLICEAGWNTLKGQTAVFEHVIKNPYNVTAKDADDFALREYEGNSGMRCQTEILCQELTK